MYSIGTWPNYFARRDFWRWDMDKGVIRQRGGARAMVFPQEFSVGLVTGLVDECGEAWPVVLHRCGHFWGTRQMTRLAAELTSFYDEATERLPTGVAHAAIAECFAIHGWGRASFDLSSLDKGVLIVEVTDSPIARALMGKELGDKPVDALLAGALAGMFSRMADAEMDCHEVGCVARGDSRCTFVLTLKSKAKTIAELVRRNASLADVIASIEG